MGTVSNQNPSLQQFFGNLNRGRRSLAQSAVHLLCNATRFCYIFCDLLPLKFLNHCLKDGHLTSMIACHNLKLYSYHICCL